MSRPAGRPSTGRGIRRLLVEHTRASVAVVGVVVVALIVAGSFLAWNASRPAQPETRSTPLVALFIGDSYTHGTGSSDVDSRWTSLVAAAEGWKQNNAGLGGTGYLTTAGVSGCGRPYCENYLEVVGLSAQVPADIVVIAGGQNDFRAWIADPTAVAAQITATYVAARAAHPDARILAVGPSTRGNVSAPVIAFDAAVQDAAAQVDAEYVSLIDPNVIQPGMAANDAGHVNDLGHAAIAAAVLAALGDR